MLQKVVIAAVLLVIVNASYAHTVKVHEHTKLIPLPPYSQAHGEAGGAASLAAAQAFLAAFDEQTRQQMMFGLHADERATWSNLPAGINGRAGLSVGEMSDPQRALLFEFLSASLSQEGYRRVMDIMAAEAFLSEDRRAKRIGWAPENYWISFYGTPSADAPWGWQYGGHHLALNLSVENGAVESMSPTFVGTEPAVFTYDGVDYRSVVDMHEAGYAMLLTLDAEQRQMADAGAIPDDVVTGPGEDHEVPESIGLPAANMSADQRKRLLSLIGMWVAVQPIENAAPRMQQISRQLDETRFAWSGSSVVNEPVYMRIQGPTLIIELHSDGGNVGRNARGQGHYHTIYRNFANEYGSPR